MTNVFYLSSLPDDPNASALVTIAEADRIHVDGYRLPFPSPQLMSYGEPLPDHIASGRRDGALITRILAERGVAGPVLDFACASGRTLRWLADYAAEHEVWGVDIDGKCINWCQNYLSPPFNFSMITTHPHFPFEDRFFSLVYGYSIFTHLDELFMAWLCELRRCIRIDGLLFVTICDEVSVERQLKQPNSWVSRLHRSDENVPRFLDPETLICYKRFSNTLFTHTKRDYFLKLCKPCFDLVEIYPDAMGLQTGLLLKRSR